MKKIISTYSLATLVFGLSTVWGCSAASEDPTSGVPETPGQTNPGDQNPSDPAKSSTVQGRVTNEGTGETRLGLAGANTMAEAKTVRISQVIPGQPLKTIGETAIAANGTYSLKVPAVDLAIAQVLNVKGEVIGSVIVGSILNVAGGLTISAPISTVSSIQALVLANLSLCVGVDPAALVATVTGLVDGELSKAIASAVAGGANLDQIVKAVSGAVISAHDALFAALGSLGAPIDTKILADLEKVAFGVLSQALNAGDLLSGLPALDKFAADISKAIAQAAHTTIEVATLAQAAAAAALQAALSSALKGVPNVSGIVFAATHAVSTLQAKLVAQALNAVMAASGAPAEVIEAVTKIGDQLVKQIAAATNLDLIKAAKLDAIHALLGDLTGKSAGIVGLLTQVTSQLTAILEGTLKSVNDLTAQLEKQVGSSASSLPKVNVCGVVGVSASAGLDVNVKDLIAALTKFVGDVQKLAPDLNGVLTAVQAKSILDALTLVQGILTV